MSELKVKSFVKQLLCCAQSWAPYQLKPFNINVWIRSYPSIFFTALSVRVTRFLSQPSIYQAKGQGSLWTGRQSVAGPEFGLSICRSLPTPLTVLSLNYISLQTQNIEKKRDAVVCCLINYLGERQEDLFHDCQECEDYTDKTMKVIVKHSVMAEEDPSDLSVVIEGNQVMEGCGSWTKACILLMGLGMARYHNFGFGTIPESNTSVSILNRYYRWPITSLKS